MAERSGYRRIGHKGADAIVTGNTLESFEAAIEAGVDMIEFDVLRTPYNRLVVAHDYDELERRKVMALTDALDAFLEPPLDEIEFDCDLKLPGREAELAGALAGRGLLDRAMVSTMELDSLRRLKVAEPDLRLGWTYPKTKRDWTGYRWAAWGVSIGTALMRRRLPKLVATSAPELGVDAIWVYEPLVTPRLIEAAEQLGIEVYAWTVDDSQRVGELIGMGVHGIVSNDPRLFSPAGIAKPAREEKEKEQEEGEKAEPEREPEEKAEDKDKEVTNAATPAGDGAKPQGKKKATGKRAKPAKAKKPKKPQKRKEEPEPAAAKAGAIDLSAAREEAARAETQEWVLPDRE
jgi:glycerophosphoryl diester phosphodiesterase